MAIKEATERCVYVLPTELRERIRAYQASNGIPSEVEAARRLLDSALQMGDTITDILNKLFIKYTEERDLRVLARDVLVGHALVQEIAIGDFTLEFKLKDGSKGSFNKKGGMSFNQEEGDYMIEHLFPKEDKKTASAPVQTSRPAWDSDKNVDLEDEIPF